MHVIGNKEILLKIVRTSGRLRISETPEEERQLIIRPLFVKYFITMREFWDGRVLRGPPKVPLHQHMMCLNLKTVTLYLFQANKRFGYTLYYR